jgi:hypothetical protein
MLDVFMGRLLNYKVNKRYRSSLSFLSILVPNKDASKISELSVVIRDMMHDIGKSCPWKVHSAFVAGDCDPFGSLCPTDSPY